MCVLQGVFGKLQIHVLSTFSEVSTSNWYLSPSRELSLGKALAEKYRKVESSCLVSWLKNAVSACQPGTEPGDLKMSGLSGTKIPPWDGERVTAIWRCQDNSTSAEYAGFALECIVHF